MLGPAQKRRERLEIISEILKIAQKGVLKTQIMYRVNLSFTQLKEYLSHLVRSGLLEGIVNEDRIRYVSTEKGRELVKKYYDLTTMLRSDEMAIQEYLDSLLVRSKF